MPVAATEQDTQDLVAKLGGLSMEGLYYVGFQSGKDNAGGNYSRFVVTRGYTTIKKKLTDNLDSRITLDTYQDKDGNMQVRLKYVYALFKFADLGPITKPNLEFGQVHNAWLDFEENLNFYRMQGTMFIERVGIFNSADFGLTAAGLLGGQVGDDYQKSVNQKYPGRYGSFALGLYNGSGYAAVEANKSKVFQGRLTVRPLPDVVPGAQISYLVISGKGNKPETDTTTIPDWQTSLVMLSYEQQLFAVTGQYLTGKGRNKGDWSDAVTYNGYSVFAELKPTGTWRIIARMDQLDPNKDVSDNENTRIIAGVGYDFGRRNMLLLDYDAVNFKATNTKDPSSVNLTMQVSF
jgi:hypothetical protein